MGAGVGRLALAATMLTVLSGPLARAGSIVVIGDYPQTDDGTLSSVTSLYGTYAKAVGFTMGGQSYGLDSVTLRLMEQVGSSSTLSVALFGGTPSTLSGRALVEFNAVTIPSYASNVTFTPTTSFVLQAGASYWLEVSGQSDTLNGIVWYGSNPGVSPSGMATSAGALFTDQLGASSALEPSSVMNTFEVMGSSEAGVATIPEPASLIQGAFSVALGLVYTWWRLGRNGQVGS
jgi:hypothetical protein